MFKSIEVEKLVDPFVDTGNLLLIDKDPLDPNVDESTTKVNISNEALLELSRNNAQYLFNQIWQLPRKNVDETICAELPDGVFVLPREKPIPKKREPTRWERFAQSKGIVKKKDRNRKVFDETTQEWKPRYGYRRGNDNTKDWLIEVPGNADPNKDFFAERKQQKQERTMKTEYQRMKNIQRSMTASRSSGVNSIPLGNLEAKLAANERRKLESKKEREGLTKQVYQAKLSTASVGKFQETLKDEKKPRIGQKRKFAPNEIDTFAERKHQLELYEKLQTKKPNLVASKFNAARLQSSLATKEDKNADDASADNNKKKNGGPGNKDKKKKWTKTAKPTSRQHRQQFYDKIKKGKQGGGPKKGGRKGGK